MRVVRSKALIVGALSVSLLVAACSSSSKTNAITSTTSTPAASSASSVATTSTTSAADAVLGAVNPAKGDPVLVGLISSGKTTGIDNQIEVDVANATVKWWNDRQGGIGGRPVKLVVCTDQADPGKAGDCANQLIQQNVVAAMIGSSAVVLNEWQPLNDAHIPVFTLGGSSKLYQDPTSTFSVGSPTAGIVDVAVQAAKDANKTRITAMVIDVPAATDIYKTAGPLIKAKYGIDLTMVPIAIGTPDMTPQAQRIVSGGDPGIVNVLGNDTFCIAAFNGLRAVGYKGPITTASVCISAATLKAVPADYLKGMQLSYTGPVGDNSNPSTILYDTVMKTYETTPIDLSRTTGISMFIIANALEFGVQGISGAVTPATITAAMKGMPWKLLPGAGGLHFRCNGKADPANPAVCVPGVLISSLDATGNPTTFRLATDDPIPS
jgi:branched-chain amino acid transport system substrate-binding protein